MLADPALAGTQVDPTVRLTAGPCADWRGALKPAFGDTARIRFAGGFAAACGERSWPVADADPATYNARLLEALWRDMGGRLGGRVVDGPAPAGVAPSFEHWLVERLGELPPGTLLDNGSGLSRQTRLSAALLGRLLQQAWGGAAMPELVGSLPVSGLDGTLRRSRATPGRAHLKTGSLNDVAAIAGYLLADSGRRYVIVAMINHPNAGAARPALDALVQWGLRDAPAR